MRLRAELRSWPLKPVTAALFGSVARGDGTVTSDIDVLIVRRVGAGEESDDHDRWLHQLDSLRERVVAWTGNHCQIYELDRDEFAAHVRRREGIVAEWRRDAVPLYGEPIRRLVDPIVDRRPR